jgi:hypothetical protein
MSYEIILVLNINTQTRVCEQYYYKSILLDKCVIESGSSLTIAYECGALFTHEIVKSVESFGENGLKITTTKKIWFISPSGK